MSGNAARLSGEALRAQILRLANMGDGATIEPGNGKLVLREGGRVQEITLGDMAEDAEGYVLRSEESSDPPTKPLDENGQGAPYAQFGYAALC